MMHNLSDRARHCLLLADPDDKAAAVLAVYGDWQRGTVALAESAPTVEDNDGPGRPPRPVLVPPHEVERRSVNTPEGHAALIHALAHIEFNAINLALDAVWRFRGLPREFYSDWLRVATEEAQHFMLLRDHLRELGADYGAFTAHDGLWQMAVKTAHDPLVRMALVPRLLEARGLDVNPAIVAKLEKRGDARGVEILAIILRDEVGHVRIGNRWYEYLCHQRGLDAVTTFWQLLREYGAPRPRPPFHRAARLAAGFSPEELRYLEFGGE